MKTIYIICLFCSATLADGNKLMKIEGFQGRNVSFQCSHRLAWAYDKYFCKDPCGSEKDRLATVKSGGRAESGRVTLVDSGDGSFTVTLSHLQLSDSHQKYWCGVDRPGLDTYTQIQLTVKKAVETETPDVPTTWTYQNTNTTQLTTGTDTIKPTKPSMESFSTKEQPKISTGTIVYAAVGGIAMACLLMLTVCFRKYRKTSKPQLQVCFNNTDVSSVHQQEGAEHLQKLPGRSSIHTHHQRLDPPATEPTETTSSLHLHIYENISVSKLAAASEHPPTEHQNDHDNNSGIYINPLPDVISERTEPPVNPPKRSPEHFGLV
ncbi:uncharacterized protein LOC102290930 isoform X2 [Haplochromis burtoni]|uniref:uncharacterized protein LOC102290930 isoform X2 n=1 Tax=Haplochromis burtoni TaxID=8153 RepID=UPI0003BDB22C|nr:uncharacterized protein LOC102290930 isoform X2 [Haplochromis burtoni]